MKISNTLLILIIFIISALFFFLHETREKTSNKNSIDFINSVRVDSIRKIDSGYNIYTKHNLIRVKITQYVRYVSPSDTTITVYDTIGKEIINKISIGKLKQNTQNRLAELISFVK